MSVRSDSRRFAVSGVGIDLERRRVPSRAVRFFLNEAERQWIASVANPEPHLLRIWTIKEALFKANPENEDTILADYSLEDPQRWSGRAFWNAVVFRYECAEWSGGIVTLALALTRQT